MNIRTWSMIISVLLVGVTLVSLGITYMDYKNDIAEFNRQEKIRVEEESAAAIAKHEAETGSEPDYYVDKYGNRIVNYNKIFGSIDYTGAFDPDPDSDIDDAFKTKLIIHLIIIGFIFLAEIGMLIVLPKRNSLNR